MHVGVLVGGEHGVHAVVLAVESTVQCTLGCSSVGEHGVHAVVLVGGEHGV